LALGSESPPGTPSKLGDPASPLRYAQDDERLVSLTDTEKDPQVYLRALNELF